MHVQIETLSAALEEERRLGRAKDARHKLTVQRLQRHVAQLQVYLSRSSILHTHNDQLMINKSSPGIAVDDAIFSDYWSTEWCAQQKLVTC